ncbi:MAG: sigma 54-dependent transcriptional regulator [Bacteroidetes bacterium]|nr:sigma 54-dependent transcriptional regulator [Bacteroidota bacterium]
MQYVQELSTLQVAGCALMNPPDTADPRASRSERTYSAEELLSFERTLSEISARLIQIPGDELDAQIMEGLKSIARFFNVERCTLTEYLPVTHESYCRYSYAPDGFTAIPRMRADLLFPWSTAQLRKNRPVILHYPHGFPPEADVDLRNAALGKFKSSINIPIVIEGDVRYVLSVSSLAEYREWPGDLMPRLRLFGEILGNALIRTQREAEIRRLKESAEQENISLREVVQLQTEQGEIIGKSDALQYVLYRLERVARTDATVLLLGETGVGKELFARAIHRSSGRKDRPLLKVDCAALAPSLIESELFGHERGAFTGAVAARKGRFEIAEGGTVFLDEVGELSPELQVKLLRVLEDGCVERVGASKPINVNVRIIAATNRDLDESIQEGRFRRDLFYRLNAFPLTIPPLRERQSDIPLLAEHFVRVFSARHSRPVTRITQATLNLLQEYSWPGNVRELENVIERAVITSDGKTLHVQPLAVRSTREPSGRVVKSLADVEKEHILAVLEKTMWRIEGQSGAARILGLHPDTLRHRMKKLHITRPKISER